MELIVLKAYFHKHDAEMAKGLLEDQGIPCLLQAYDMGGFRPHLTLGVGNNRLLVRPEHVEEAKAILEAFEGDGEYRS